MNDLDVLVHMLWEDPQHKGLVQGVVLEVANPLLKQAEEYHDAVQVGEGLEAPGMPPTDPSESVSLLFFSRPQDPDLDKEDPEVANHVGEAAVGSTSWLPPSPPPPRGERGGEGNASRTR